MREVVQYTAFERVFGPLTVQERVDVAGAFAAWAALSAAGSKAPLSDFIPRWGRGSAAQTPEEMIGVMRSLQKEKK